MSTHFKWGHNIEREKYIPFGIATMNNIYPSYTCLFLYYLSATLYFLFFNEDSNTPQFIMKTLHVISTGCSISSGISQFKSFL